MSTVKQLIENLQQFPDASVVAIKDVDDVEFAITDLKSEDKSVSIIIGEKEYEDDQEEES